MGNGGGGHVKCAALAGPAGRWRGQVARTANLSNGRGLLTMGGNVGHGWAVLAVEIVGGSSSGDVWAVGVERGLQKGEWRGEGAGNEWGCGSAWLGWVVEVVRRCSI